MCVPTASVSCRRASSAFAAGWLSGLPPSRLQTYYARHSWPRLTRRMIFGTDWPGIPGIAANARAVAALLPDDATVELVLSGNAARVYHL